MDGLRTAGARDGRHGTAGRPGSSGSASAPGGPGPPAPPSTGEPPSPGPDPADPGPPITVRLDDLLLGDLGNQRVDARLLQAILAARSTRRRVAAKPRH